MHSIICLQPMQAIGMFEPPQADSVDNTLIDLGADSLVDIQPIVNEDSSYPADGHLENMVFGHINLNDSDEKSPGQTADLGCKDDRETAHAEPFTRRGKPVTKPARYLDTP
ncbi:unnamed protein product [Clavelina lepadiformis]|uniref:Uncharacterized protein n=1 Tax=Clavelina lepadiformis TaxID=159417 RepID=A0ABP0FS81_CLALP